MSRNSLLEAGAKTEGQSDGVSFEIALPTKIHPLKHRNKKLLCMKCNAFCKDSTSLPGICYLADFIDTAHTIHNFVRRTKLFFFFSKKRLNVSEIPKFLF